MEQPLGGLALNESTALEVTGGVSAAEARGEGGERSGGSSSPRGQSSRGQNPGQVLTLVILVICFCKLGLT